MPVTRPDYISAKGYIDDGMPGNFPVGKLLADTPDSNTNRFVSISNLIGFQIPG